MVLLKYFGIVLPLHHTVFRQSRESNPDLSLGVLRVGGFSLISGLRAFLLPATFLFVHVHASLYDAWRFSVNLKIICAEQALRHALFKRHWSQGLWCLMSALLDILCPAHLSPMSAFPLALLGLTPSIGRLSRRQLWVFCLKRTGRIYRESCKPFQLLP